MYCQSLSHRQDEHFQSSPFDWDGLQLNLPIVPKEQTLGYSVRSTIPSHENVAVQTLGNLLCPAKQGCRLSVLSFLPHHHYIRTGHTYLIPLNTINMTPPKPPVQNPVDIPFENGSFTDHKCYPTWWLSNVDLQNVLDSLWDSFEPDTDRVVGNAHLLFSIKKPQWTTIPSSNWGHKILFCDQSARLSKATGKA